MAQDIALAEDHVFHRAVWLHKSLPGKTFNTDDVVHTKEVLHGKTEQHQTTTIRKKQIAQRFTEQFPFTDRLASHLYLWKQVPMLNMADMAENFPSETYTG